MKQIQDPDGRLRSRLETWGEIAQHLGVEIRTAQRWEGKMGLPVHRLEGSQAVFAFADELDAWRQSREKKPDPPFAPVTPPVHPGAPPAQPARRPWWAVAVAVSAVLALGAAATRWARPVIPDEPANFALQGSLLVAVAATGAPAWTHDFGEPAIQIDAFYRQQMNRWWARLDTDADGIDEIVAVVGHPSGGSVVRDVLYCFTLDGRLRYAHEPDLALSFGQQRFTAPWVVMDIEPVHADGRLWVALANSPWWPGAIVSLDPKGAATLRYTQPGVIYALRSLPEAGRTRVLAAGVSNEHGAASLAVIDPRGPPASAPPGEGGAHACADCPTGSVERYLLFEPSPANRASGLSYNRADGLEVRETIEVSAFESERTAIIYQLSRDFVVLSATPSDTYWSPELRETHARAFKDDPLAARIRTWTSAGWTESSAPYPAR